MQQYHRQNSPAVVQPQIWEAASSERVCVAGVAELYRQTAANQFDLLLRERDVSDMESSSQLCFYGPKPDRLLGYAAYHVFGPQPLEELFIDEDAVFESYCTREGHRITERTIGRFEGFDQFDTNREVLYIEKFEIKRDAQGLGHGSAFMEQLVSRLDPGFVFLHARDSSAEDFFLQNGFSYANILNGYCGEEVMVLNRD